MPTLLTFYYKIMQELKMIVYRSNESLAGGWQRRRGSPEKAASKAADHCCQPHLARLATARGGAR